MYVPSTGRLIYNFLERSSGETLSKPDKGQDRNCVLIIMYWIFSCSKDLRLNINLSAALLWGRCQADTQWPVYDPTCQARL